MKVGILQVGQIAPEVLAAVADGLAKTYPDTTASVIEQALPMPQHAFDKKRSQYNASVILNDIGDLAVKQQGFHCVLGVVDVDIYAAGLNYVFGEAFTSGPAGVISLWRLKPEFYGEKPDSALYLLRARKEAIHEVGHTLGLKHCPNALCVMHFSNCIFDTDKKQSLLCDESYLQAAITIANIGNQK